MASPEGSASDEGRLDASPGGDVPRLVISWSIVGIPLIYGVVETVRAILPLFGH
ncbi:MFS transporter small subunit [Spirillospora sp. CA-128828]|uniref:MFS transporter small subunit n=1 Tax=Spirillospora sp. CA-128828 TaxID=3240033 RepID=UPI003D901651